MSNVFKINFNRIFRVPGVFLSIPKKRLLRKISVFWFLVATFCFAFVRFDQTRKLNEIQLDFVGKPSLKNILIWNSHDRFMFRTFGYGQEAFFRNNCPNTNCRLLLNLSQVAEAAEIDAFVINVHHVYSMDHLPKIDRKQNQKFVLFTQEPPSLMPFSSVPWKYANIFNWTMNYNRKSDIVLKYGRVHRRKVSLSSYINRRAAINSKNSMNYAAHKTKLVAWFVSNCRTSSKREDLVRELKKYIPIDVYGKCGPLRCEKSEEKFISSPECYDYLDASYKFYLSFENSLCKDYVTEKFFYILQKRVVPIVYGSANYEDLAPPHSFIDASRFTPKSLAEYLQLLDKNDTLYNEYFAWKTDYWVEAGVGQMMRYAFCQLCQKLHEEDDGADAKILSAEDLNATFAQGTQCEQPLRFDLMHNK